MKTPKYSPLSTLIQTFGSTKIGAWVFAKTLHHFDRYVFKMSNGRTTITAFISGLPMLVLTTTGAKSGLQRTTPLIYASDSKESKQIGVIASNYGQTRYPSWYHNLKANPEAEINIEGLSYSVVAHEAEGGEYDHYWSIFTKVYKGYPEYKKRVTNRHIPIMVLVLKDS